MTIGTTGITVTPSLWDIKKQRLKGKSTEALQVNKKLDNIEDEIRGISDKLEYEGKLSLEKVKAIYLNAEDESNTICALFDKFLTSVQEQVVVNHLSAPPCASTCSVKSASWRCSGTSIIARTCF